MFRTSFFSRSFASRAGKTGWPIAWVGFTCALGTAVLAGAENPFVTPAAPDAPTVAPAPVLEQPLPPAVSQEVAEPQPSPQHVWIPGHWRWQEGTHVWIAPHWELPP